MRKLSLELHDLRVDTFETMPAKLGSRGTVRAQEATEYTQCYTQCYGGCGGTKDWGGCGGESDGAFGCGGGSEGCTLDPYNDNCYSYAQQCPMTVYPSWSCDYTCGADVGDTVCAGNCTDQCTT